MSFEAAYGGERVIAQLHLPREKPPPYQVVVYSPAGSALFLRSSEHVGFPDFTFLVRSGRAVLLPVFKGTYERRFPRGAAGPNNFSEPTSDTSDAILAFDATSGAIVWSNQRTKDDLWNLRFPFSTEHPDFDFGDSAQVYTLSNGRKVVGAGQKSGFYHVLDAATGDEVLEPEQYVPGGVLGGLFADTAVANGVIHANVIEWNPFDPSSPPLGHLFAFSADTLAEEWHFETPGSPNLSGVAVANGVVYFQSVFDGNLYALDATTGAQLLALPVGPSTSGPAVSNGRVYMGTGDAILRPGLGAPPALPGGIIAIGLR